MTSSPLPSPSIPPAPRPEKSAAKKAYQPPRVQVHGDVKTLTGFGARPGGPSPFAPFSPALFS